jgi:short subunit dehydrogenase-like uncharacterized protein
VSARELDIVVFGATGFIGSLTADYLAAHVPDGARIGLAGRNLDRLAAVRDRLGMSGVALIRADAADPASLAALAARARVTVSTVGPYLEHGEPLVKACAEAGTDYLDLTGEPEFVDRMYVAYDHVARQTGARLVHACGFDSIPHDLGVLFTVTALGARGPVRARGVVRTNGTLSGGTLRSALGQFGRPLSLRSAARARAAAEKTAGVGHRRVSVGWTNPVRDSSLGCWLVPLPTIDPQIVLRSAAALPVYGERFSYGHYAGTRTLRYAAGGVVGAVGLLVAAQVPPVRRWIGRRIPQGAGPSTGRRETSWFTVDFWAEGDGRAIRTRVSGGDPGYGETSKMLAESALCLAFDHNPDVSGQVTTAVAMGEQLIARLRAAGISFENAP